MSIPVTDEIIDALIECADELEAEIDNRYNAPDIHPALKGKYERDLEPVKRARAAVAVAGKDEPSGNPGELRDAIRAAVLKEREECAHIVDDYRLSFGGNWPGMTKVASLIRSRPDPSEDA